MQILLPFFASAGSKKVTIIDYSSSDHFACLANIQTHTENYTLSCRWGGLDKGSLIAGNHASVIVQTELRMNGQTIPIDRLVNSKLTITGNHITTIPIPQSPTSDRDTPVSDKFCLVNRLQIRPGTGCHG